MVSVTRVGCTVCTVTPAGTRTLTSAGALLAPRPDASTIATTCPGARPCSVPTGPASTTATACGSLSASRLLPGLTAFTPTTGNGRVPTYGATETVTLKPACRTS